MNSALKLFPAAGLLIFTGLANANWTGGIEAGARIGSDERPALRFFLNKASEPLSHFTYIDWIQVSGGSNYRLGYEPTYRVSHSIYSFGRFSIEQNDPGGIEQEIEASVGIGNNLFQRGNTRARIEAGIGAQQLEFIDSTDEADGFVFLSGTISSSLLALVRLDATISTKVNNESTNIDTEVGFSIPVGPGTQLRYVYQSQRFNLDDRENIVTEDNFFTVSYGF